MSGENLCCFLCRRQILDVTLRCAFDINDEQQIPRRNAVGLVTDKLPKGFALAERSFCHFSAERFDLMIVQRVVAFLRFSAF